MTKKQLLALAALAMMSVPATTMAQDDDEMGDDPVYPTLETGYFRLVNNGYGDVLSLDAKHTLSLSQTENAARTMPATIFYYDTNGIYSFSDDMAQLGDNITVADLMRLMATSAWKSGDYTTYDLSSQGISLGGYLRRLNDFVNAALADFPQSDAVKDFYENGPAWYLAVAMSGAFYPADMESLEAFRAAVDRYMKQWKNYFDCSIYLKPAQNTTNSFLIHFHAPMDISKVMDTQAQINNMADSETGQPYGYNYDFFGAFKRQVVEEAAKELDAEGVAYVERVLEPLVLDYEYYIGENEQGELYVQGLSKEAMFGENGELAQINQDELLWTLQPVDETNPLMVGMESWSKAFDDYYYTTMFTEFPYQLGEGVEAFYVAAEDDKFKLVSIEAKVPARTGVFLRSKSPAAVSNVLLPLNEEVPAIEGNQLKGTCLPLQLDDYAFVWGLSGQGDDAKLGLVRATTDVPANSCYFSRKLILVPADTQGITTVSAQSSTLGSACYDLQGRRVAEPTHGIYVMDGKKVVR
ncbi:MAG: hypothetical protein IJ176_03420 [Prevotella sp.]|nr:hypothetical protein [Prevotella sp.]